MDTRATLLSVVIPAYNEEARIEKTLNSIGAFLRKQDYRYEIIVVDDVSRDGTQDIVTALKKRVAYLKVLRHEENCGKGWAVRTGMLHSSGQYRLFMDADGSTSIEHWEPLKEELDRGVDVAISSRHASGSSIQVRQAPHREALGYLFRMLIKGLFRLPVSDTQNGFKAFRAEAAERIFRLQRVRGWAFDVELLSIAKSLGYTLSEVPIRWIDDDRSRVTFISMPIMLADIVRIRIHSSKIRKPRTPPLPRPQLIHVQHTFKDIPRTS